MTNSIIFTLVSQNKFYKCNYILVAMLSIWRVEFSSIKFLLMKEKSRCENILYVCIIIIRNMWYPWQRSRKFIHMCALHIQLSWNYYFWQSIDSPSSPNNSSSDQIFNTSASCWWGIIKEMSTTSIPETTKLLNKEKWKHTLSCTAQVWKAETDLVSYSKN